MYYLFILFAFFSQFNSLLQISSSGATAGAPFAWGFAFLALFLYVFSVKKKHYIDTQTLSLVLIFFIVILWAPLQIQSVFSEYIIRFLQFLSAVTVYIYSKNNFFLNIPKEKIIKYFLILQLPSVFFGLIEVLHVITDNSLIRDILYDIRSLTSGRPDVVYMKTIVFHFFEHSMSVSYILMLVSLMAVWLNSKLKDLNSNKWLSILIYKYGYSWFSFFFISTILFLLFHRSGTYVIIAIGVLFFGVIKSDFKNKIYFLFSSLVFLYLIVNSPTLMIKVDSLMSGQLVSSDFYRFSSILSSVGNLVHSPFGIGPGSYSSEYFTGIINFLDYFSLDPIWRELVYSNSDIMAKQGFNPARVTTQTLYLGLFSELGVFFILFFLAFHKNIFIKKYGLIKLIEVAVVINLCLGYPMAYPQLWIALGFLHGVYKNKI